MLRTSNESVTLTNIPLEEITTTALLNFRTQAEQSEDFGGLADSIGKYGLLQPLLVRNKVSYPKKEGLQNLGVFQIVAGHRRYFACKKIGLHSVACIVMELSDQEAFEVALVENVQRQSLNPIEEAEAFKSYVVNFGRGSITRLARKIGKSEEYVSHRLLMLGLPKILLEKISRRLLKPSHATELVWLKNGEQQVDLSNEISEYSLSLREVRAAVRFMKSSNIDVDEVVQRVLKEREAKRPEVLSVATDAVRADDADAALNPWPEYNERREDNAAAKEKDILDHSILILRTCLAGLDLLVNEAQGSDLLGTFMEERNSVHSILDKLIRVSTDYRRNRVTVPSTS